MHLLRGAERQYYSRYISGRQILSVRDNQFRTHVREDRGHADEVACPLRSLPAEGHETGLLQGGRLPCEIRDGLPTAQVEPTVAVRHSALQIARSRLVERAVPVVEAGGGILTGK